MTWRELYPLILNLCVFASLREILRRLFTLASLREAYGTERK